MCSISHCSHMRHTPKFQAEMFRFISESMLLSLCSLWINQDVRRCQCFMRTYYSNEE